VNSTRIHPVRRRNAVLTWFMSSLWFMSCSTMCRTIFPVSSRRTGSGIAGPENIKLTSLLRWFIASCFLFRWYGVAGAPLLDGAPHSPSSFHFAIQERRSVGSVSSVEVEMPLCVSSSFSSSDVITNSTQQPHRSQPHTNNTTVNHALSLHAFSTGTCHQPAEPARRAERTAAHQGLSWAGCTHGCPDIFQIPGLVDLTVFVFKVDSKTTHDRLMIWTCQDTSQTWDEHIHRPLKYDGWFAWGDWYNIGWQNTLRWT